MGKRAAEAPRRERRKSGSRKGERLLLSPIVTGSALRKPTGQKTVAEARRDIHESHLRSAVAGIVAAAALHLVAAPSPFSLADAAARYAQDRGIVNTNRACHFPWLSSALPQLDQGSWPWAWGIMVVPPC